MGEPCSLWWRVAQAGMMAGAAVMWLALWFAPDAGLAMLWNILIPAAPALFVIATGLWRNICPLGTISLLPRYYGVSQRRRLSRATQGRLQLAGVLLLLLLVPLRHVTLNLSGPATAITLAALALLAVTAGWYGEWKSAWCSGLCPVLPVEMLYGKKTVRSFANAHCASCQACVVHCVDSPGVAATALRRTPCKGLADLLMTGGFPGFIAGWMQVPDYAGSEGWNHALEAWGIPAAGMACSLTIYLSLRSILPDHRRALLAASFAAASISIYYWFRLPSLLGFCEEGRQAGVLFDLRAAAPAWTPAVLRAATTGFFLAWFLRPGSGRAWMPRPRTARHG